MPEPKEWLGQLEEGLRNEPTIQNFNSVSDLVKGYKEATHKISQKGVIIPGENASEEEINRFHESLGRPKTADEYPSDLPAAIQNSQGLEQLKGEIAEFKEMCFKMGMSKKQFNTAFKYRIDKSLAQAKAADEARTVQGNKVKTDLMSRLGAKYDETISGVQKMINFYGKDLSQESIDKLNSDPEIVMTLSRILEQFSEGTLETLGHAKTGTMTPEEAKEKIEQIMADKEHPYNNPKVGAKHNAALEEMDKLYILAYPGMKRI